MKPSPTTLAKILAVLTPVVAAGAEHPRLVSIEAAQCVDCHEALIEGRSWVHPPAAEDCTTCHEFSIDEEGTSVVLMEAEPALCVLCHDDKEIVVEMELATPHMPAADSCLTCHNAHASDYEHVLIAATGDLCAECHDVADLDEAHSGQLTEATDCATCHEPHGSENQHMLAASRLHPPFEEGSCQGCHRAPFGDRIRLRVRGERLCTSCHGEFEHGEGGSTHAALTGERGRAGCLSCHDPHMSNHRAILLESGPRLCAKCHTELVAAASAEGGHYPAGEDCLNCHQPHTADEDHLLVEKGTEICGTCHDLKPAPSAKPPAALEIVGTGRGSYGPAAVVAAAAFDNGTPEPALCAQPFPEGTWSGEIVLCDRGGVLRVLKSRNVALGGAGGMILANQPDGSNDLAGDAHTVPAVHIRSGARETVLDWLGAGEGTVARIENGKLLLDTPVPTGRRQGDLQSVHLGADLERLDCLGCHTPHGEGNPKLLARHLHPPVEDGCDTCHEGGSDELMEGGGSELCLFCHDDPSLEATVPHAAMELGECTDCHNPHASAQERLIKAPGAGPCAECHDEQVAGPGEVEHGAITLLGCRACHEPHGGSQEKLLIRTGPDLCLGCHARPGAAQAEQGEPVSLLDRFEVPAAVASEIATIRLSGNGERDHPVLGHRVRGMPSEEELRRTETTFEGELSCLSCHDPHKGRSPKILRWQAVSPLEACLACHEK